MKAIAIDTETTGLDPFHGDRPFAVSLCDHRGKTWWYEWDVNPYTREVKVRSKDRQQIHGLIGQYDVLVFHNALFDIRMLEAIEIDITSRWQDVHDTLGSAHVLDNEEPHGLKELAYKYLHIPDDDESDLIAAVDQARKIAVRNGWAVKRGSGGKGCDYWLPRAVDPHSTICQKYGVNDAVRTMSLFLLHQQELTKQGLMEHYQRERKVLRETYDMITRGVTLRPRVLPAEIDRYTKLTEKAERTIKAVAAGYGMTDFNVRSPKQLSELLFQRGGLPVIKIKQTGPSTDAETIETLLASKLTPVHKRLLEAVIEYRKPEKARGYLQEYANVSIPGIINRPTLHARFNPWGTRTTRFSCSEPNLQNVGKSEDEDTGTSSLRLTFGPPPDMLWIANDYNQLELRILAADSQEPSMVKAFANGVDIHENTRQAIMRATGQDVPRRAAKNANYAVVYGGGREKLYRMTGVADMYDLFKAAYPDVDRYSRRIIAHAKRHGWIATMTGYRLYVPQDRPYAAVDYRIQGTAGDLIKTAIADIGDYFRNAPHLLSDGGGMIMMIHDELVIQIAKSYCNAIILRDLKELMEAPGRRIGLVTPVDTKIITTSWAEGKPWNGKVKQ